MSNSLETSLTTIALSYFPWDTQARPWRYVNLSILVGRIDRAVGHSSEPRWRQRHLHVLSGPQMQSYGCFWSRFWHGNIEAILSS